MKTTDYFTFAACILILASCDIEVASDNKEQLRKEFAHSATSTFKVWGNCEMCEETIEGSLNEPGIALADWNRTTKQISVNYDSTVFSLDDIQKKIAASGYDTEKYKADEEAYANLHECCQYERKP